MSINLVNTFPDQNRGLVISLTVGDIEKPPFSWDLLIVCTGAGRKKMRFLWSMVNIIHRIRWSHKRPGAVKPHAWQIYEKYFQIIDNAICTRPQERWFLFWGGLGMFGDVPSDRSDRKVQNNLWQNPASSSTGQRPRQVQTKPRKLER